MWCFPVKGVAYIIGRYNIKARNLEFSADQQSCVAMSTYDAGTLNRNDLLENPDVMYLKKDNMPGTKK